MGAEGFHGRVRNGIGCFAPRYSHQVVRTNLVCCVRRGRRDLGEPRSTRPARVMSRGGIAVGTKPLRAWRCMRRECEYQADRAIRIGKLNALPRFHIRPINVVVYHGSSGRPRLKVGFPLRCIQRLSRPHIATRRCRWRDNRYTRGASIPVLSY